VNVAVLDLINLGSWYSIITRDSSEMGRCPKPRDFIAFYSPKAANGFAIFFNMVKPANESILSCMKKAVSFFKKDHPFHAAFYRIQLKRSGCFPAEP